MSRRLGPKSARWLAEAGIHGVEGVLAVGAVEAYCRVRDLYPDKVTLNMLWGLLGVEYDLPWDELPHELKRQALAELEHRDAG